MLSSFSSVRRRLLSRSQALARVQVWPFAVGVIPGKWEHRVLPDAGWVDVGDPYLEKIKVEKGGWIYEYRVIIKVGNALGTNKNLSFKFTDETNDVYSLFVMRKNITHYVDYNSEKPAIKKVTWDFVGPPRTRGRRKDLRDSFMYFCVVL